MAVAYWNEPKSLYETAPAARPPPSPGRNAHCLEVAVMTADASDRHTLAMRNTVLAASHAPRSSPELALPAMVWKWRSCG